MFVSAEQIKELNQELMKHEEQLREVKKNNTVLEKKLEHERFVKSLHTSKKKFDFRTLNTFFFNAKYIFFMLALFFH